MDDRAKLISRIELAYVNGHGCRLSHAEIGLLMAKTEPVAADHETAADATPRRSADQLDVQIRWLIRRDMPEVLRIEQHSFEFSWTEEDFLCCLRQRNCIGMVAEWDHRIVGFMIYEFHKERLSLLNLAVDPDFRRRRVGRQMVERLIEKLHQQRRTQLAMEVRETNTDAQVFFRACGFLCVDVYRNHYDATREDAYLMMWNTPAAEEKGTAHGR